MEQTGLSAWWSAVIEYSRNPSAGLRHALDDFPSDPVEGEEHMVKDPNGKHSIETHKCCILSRMGAIDSSYMPRSFLNP